MNEVGKKWLTHNLLTLHTSKLHLFNVCLNSSHNDRMHSEQCGKVVAKLTTADKSSLKFKNCANSLEIPFIIYSDFECV